MQELYIFRVFILLTGVVGLAMAVGIVLAPNFIASIEKNLNKSFSTDKLEKMLNESRNVTEILLRHPRIFGFFLLFVSFFLTLSALLLY